MSGAVEAVKLPGGVGARPEPWRRWEFGMETEAVLTAAKGSVPLPV